MPGVRHQQTGGTGIRAAAARLRRLALIVPALLIPFAALAGDASSPVPPLTVGWTNLSPTFFNGPNGEPAGFGIDLMNAVSAETGIPVKFRRYDKIPDLRIALETGEADVASALSKLPFLEGLSVFSAKVADSGYVMVTRVEDKGKYDPDTMTGVRYGILPGGSGERLGDVLERNIRLDQPNITTMLMELLRGRLDVVFSTPDSIFAEARELQLDHRIAFHEKALLTVSRHIGLYNTRADLLSRVNEALGRLEADGTLDRLRRKYFLTLPDPEPDRLKVGVWELPPYQTVGADGRFTGLAVENFRDLAGLAGLDFEFVAMEPEELLSGISTGLVDVLLETPALNAAEPSPDRTIAVDAAEYLVVFRRKGDTGIGGVASLNGRNVGFLTVEDAGPDDLLEQVDPTWSADPAELISALADERFDALVGPRNVLSVAARLSEHRDDVEASAVIRPIYRAITLRTGLGKVRERLNAVIPGYIVSSRYRELQDDWLSEPVYWTQERIRNVAYTGAGFAGVVVLLTGGLFLLNRYRQLRHVEILNGRLHDKNAELEKANEMLLRSNGELDSFAHIASHDLKEPLRALASHAAFLKEDFGERLGESGDARLNRISFLSGQMTDLVDALFYYSRLGRAVAGAEIVDVGALITSVRASLMEMLTGENADILLETDLPNVLGNPAHLDTVFRNLISNGVRYNESERKLISIGCHPVSGEPEKGCRLGQFYVRDNGIGIDERFQEDIFRIFKRLHSRKAYAGGTGSGLTFTRKIVELNGGTINCTSAPGFGSTFHFTWPLAEG